jgi:methylated-DNA-[protein]-cysteine S-methyltransferase
VNARSYALFDTPLGSCLIAWTERGVSGVQLPEAEAAQTLRRAQRRFGADLEAIAPPAVQQTITDIVALLSGRPVDLSHVALDMDGVPDFDGWVYAVARRIGPGRTQTYGEIATTLGEPALARAVGQALGRNPFAIVVPCHRVIAADGRLGGFSASGGARTKQRLLLAEGARPGNEPGLFDAT